MSVVVVVAAATYYIGWWGSCEHRLTASVRHHDCQRITTSHDGWGGSERALSAYATSRFTASCEELGPMVTWVRFANVPDMRRALAATPTGNGSSLGFSTVCVSQSRAEVVLFDGVSERRVTGLCADRDGRVVYRP